ncbi:Protein argonaute [Sphaceloma murrayae]|uniref:Protein argonaute n=1 Tax=Sphaceloma murrayae TaxID=2082308 RepID=A0A2K1QMR7_9PEZI|nr:Protein argonaute [Sphaceloma murrayae]
MSNRGGGAGSGGFRGGRGGGQRGGGSQRGGGQDRGGFRGRPGRGDLPYHPAGDRGARGSSPRGRGAAANEKFTQRDISRARSMYTDGSQNQAPSVDAYEKPRLYRGAATEGVDKESLQAETAQLTRRVEGKLPKRTGYGAANGGPKETAVVTNYLKLLPRVDATNKQHRVDQPIYRYSLATAEQKMPKGKMRALARMVLTEPRFHASPEMRTATDFMGIIISSHKVDLGPDDTWSSEVDLRDATERAQDPNNNRVRLVAFEVKLTGTFTLGPLVKWLKGDPSIPRPQREEITQILNIIFGYYAVHNRLHVHQIGPTNKFFYDSYRNQNSADLGAGLRALRGYIASVRLGGGRMLLNLNVVSGAFYKLLPLRLLAWHLLKGDQATYDPSVLTPIDKKRLENMLKLVRIENHYEPLHDAEGKVMRNPDGTEARKKISRTICGFNPPHYLPATQQRFNIVDETTGQTRSVTVFEHFRRKYPNSGYEQDHGWPCVNVGTRAKPTYIPLQLCVLAPAQAVRRMLSGDQTSNMINFAARAPHANADKIISEGVAMFRLSPENQNEFQKQFGISAEPQLMKVPARFLNTPGLAYHKDGNKRARPPVIMGAWNLRGMRFYEPVTINKVVFVELNTWSSRGGNRNVRRTLYKYQPRDITQTFIEEFKRYGVKITEMEYMSCEVPAGGTFVNQPDYERAIDETFAAIKKKAGVSIWCLDEASTFTYSYIKKMGDVKHGVQSTCMTGKKLDNGLYKKDPGFFGNIALKINIKGDNAKGVNHYVQPNEIQDKDVAKIWDNDTMFIGIDVTHPAPGSTKATPSIAAVVANTNDHLAQWPGSLRRQAVSREEMVDSLQEMVVERLRLWQKVNKGSLPNRIIVYRDGVSEGQFPLVLQHERPGIAAAIKQMYTGKPQPRLAIITVTKRHHTRFYPSRTEDMDTSGRDRNTGEFKTTGNCRPGLVVDRGVTDPEAYDFFLQAHAGLQGTVRPARYTVLHDELAMGPDGLQKMTHTLCYLFNRATRAVSVAPPAYYADLLAERARCYLYNTYHGANIGATEENDDGGVGEWNGALHPSIRDTTFYI